MESINISAQDSASHPVHESSMPLTHYEHENLLKIQAKALWLAVRMIDYANHDRPNIDGLKVGGHQASSASMVSILTALYFHHVSAEDRISVKPHASPVYHAMQYLLGNLDKRYSFSNPPSY